MFFYEEPKFQGLSILIFRLAGSQTKFGLSCIPVYYNNGYFCTHIYNNNCKEGSGGTFFNAMIKTPIFCELKIVFRLTIWGKLAKDQGFIKFFSHQNVIFWEFSKLSHIAHLIRNFILKNFETGHFLLNGHLRRYAVIISFYDFLWRHNECFLTWLSRSISLLANYQ